MKAIILISLLFNISLLQARQNLYFCDNKELEALPIRQDGRVKPLYVHANEGIKYLTGKKKVGDLSAVTAYCMLSLQGMNLPNELKVYARVDHVEVKDILGLDENRILLSDIKDQNMNLRKELVGVKVQGAKEKAISKLLNQSLFYENIVSGQNWLYPAVTKDRVDWVPLGAYITEEKILEARKTSQNPFISVLQTGADRFKQMKGKKHLIEYRFMKAKLPSISLLLTLLALACLTLFKKFTAALFFSFSTLLAQFIIVVVRIYISGRAPITNMYETVMFSGFGALLLAMAIGHLKKEKVFVYVGLMYNACTLMMMNFATGMLSESISPLVPVLRDNFWLSTHVTMIIVSYGALALSWILANTVIIKKYFSTMETKDENYYNDLIYTCLKYGTVMLGAGIILGGVWADYSWGRFWGWDPKETWSLIAFIIYMAILHGRFTSWIDTEKFTLYVASAFMSILMAWFGVNYILASGLHSYGFSEGGAIFLGTIFLAQALIVALSQLRKNKPIT